MRIFRGFRDAEPFEVAVRVRPRTPEWRLMFLRIMLFTEMGRREGEDLAEFWALLDDVQQRRNQKSKGESK